MRAQELAEEAEVTAEEARAARDDAETANRLKDEFMALVSHELRTPLNAVLGWARLLGSGQLDPERAVNAVRTIERNAEALTRIIDDLLDASRIFGGSIRAESVPVDLVAVIQAAMDQIRLAAEAKGLRMIFSCATPPDPVAGDALRLQQVVSNLLSNAVKFTTQGGRIDVALKSEESYAEIQISDTGQGIDPAFLPRIFDRFTQADSSTTRRQSGLGLGLAIVRGLVAHHAGSVTAESAGLGKGATFTVRLPLLISVSDATQGYAGQGYAQAAVARSSAARHIRLDGIQVILVEDNRDSREVLALILELAGATVTSFGSVEEALGAFDALRPHVIVSDIGMPDNDGFSLIERVRSREAERGNAAVPAIALTGLVRPEDRTRILAAGFQTHLRKPVEPDEVVATIASLASLKRI